MRTGLIARKLGMSSVFNGDGSRIPVTVLKVDNCRVVAQRTEENNGYNALQLGYGLAKVKNVSKAMRGHFAKSKVEPSFKLAEFRISADAFVDVGTEISVDHFVADQFVDIAGTSIGKGFAGGMKRHNFGGLRATHGISVSHRSLGSTGQCQDPGKVFKGKKMAGRMGGERVTVHNLKVVATDTDRGIIMVKGAVPGASNGFVLVSDAVKKKLPDGVPFPASVAEAKSEEVNQPATAEEANSPSNDDESKE